MASSWRASMSFVFLHLFCGPVDILAEELAKAGKEQGIVVETEGYDLARGHDLRCPQLAAQIRAKARAGHYAGGHSGFPCSTFSKLRWRVAPRYQVRFAPGHTSTASQATLRKSSGKPMKVPGSPLLQPRSSQTSKRVPRPASRNQPPWRIRRRQGTARRVQLGTCPRSSVGQKGREQNSPTSTCASM